MTRQLKSSEVKMALSDGFFSKIYLGYALDLYDKATRDDLRTILKIRNAFAHAMRPNFIS